MFSLAPQGAILLSAALFRNFFRIAKLDFRIKGAAFLCYHQFRCMSGVQNIKRWFWLHKWSSLICTLFLLEICITGLPLIFADEIDGWLNPTVYEKVASDSAAAKLNNMVSVAHQRYPLEVISSLYIDDEEPQVLLYMQPSFASKPDEGHSLQFDSRTGKLLKDDPPFSQQPETFIGLMFSLHTDLFMELPGELFLGLMGLLFIVAIVSGLALYGPFMKKLPFGSVRYEKARRLKWLDLHNLLGIVLGVWMFVVGVTGVINELATPLFNLWQNETAEKILKPYAGTSVPQQSELTSLDAAFDTTRKILPNMTIVSAVYPGSQFGTPYHYLLWAKGNTPFTSKLFSPVLIDARTGGLTTVVEMPAYLRALEVSRPLHFGDYGGTPLKIIWAVFDVGAIAVLISGIYLWFARRKSKEAWLQKIVEKENNI